MADQLIPPPELAPPSVDPRLTPQQKIGLWVEWMNVCEQFLLAGLRLKIGPEGDLKEAYRQWNRQQMEEHDQMMWHMMEEFERRMGGGHGR